MFTGTNIQLRKINQVVDTTLKPIRCEDYFSLMDFIADRYHNQYSQHYWKRYSQMDTVFYAKR